MKSPGQTATVDVKGLDILDHAMLNKVLHLGVVQRPIMEALEEAINEAISSRVSDDDGEEEEE